MALHRNVAARWREGVRLLFRWKWPNKWEWAVFTQSKPYVIYGYAAIPAEKKAILMLDPMYISTQTRTYQAIMPH
jgi:hypothetical protein